MTPKVKPYRKEVLVRGQRGRTGWAERFKWLADVRYLQQIVASQKRASYVRGESYCEYAIEYLMSNGEGRDRQGSDGVQTPKGGS